MRTDTLEDPSKDPRIEQMRRFWADYGNAPHFRTLNATLLKKDFEYLMAKVEGLTARNAELTAALVDVRDAIVRADPDVLTDTLWMPEDKLKGATVVDRIDMAIPQPEPLTKRQVAAMILQLPEADQVAAIKEAGIDRHLSGNMLDYEYAVASVRVAAEQDLLQQLADCVAKRLVARS